MLLYHGSHALFNEFKIGGSFSNTEESNLAEGYGVYLVEDINFAKSYGPNLYVTTIDSSDISDFTSKDVVKQIIFNIGSELSIILDDYLDSDHLVEMISSGHYSSLSLPREIQLLLDSKEQFYNRNDYKYIYENISNVFQMLIKDTVKYYDRSFKCNIFINHKNPNKLKIKEIIN